MTTTYRYLLANLLTNEIIAELPLTGVAFTQQLNQAGTFSGHLLLSGINTKQFNVDNSTIPGKCAIYVDRDGVLVWGGVIWGRSYSSANQTITYNAREFESYFERRRINQDTVFNNTDQLVIARTLVTNAQAQPYGDIGIQVGTETSGILISRTYYNYELKTVYGALQDLSRGQDGFDFNIDVKYVAGVPTKILELGYPQYGKTIAQNPFPPVFIFPAGNIVEYEYPEDGTIAANKIYALGAGSNEGKLIKIATNLDYLGQGWPLLEDQGNYSDVTDGTYLEQLAIGQVKAVGYPPTTMKIVVPAYVDPVYRSDYEIGYQARIIITDDRFPNTLDVIYRIVGLSVQPGEDGPERVTLTLTLPTSN